MKRVTTDYQKDRHKFLRNPVVAEFLGFSQDAAYSETNLESVLIDLKTTRITHEDIGQMDMYIRMLR